MATALDSSYVEMALAAHARLRDFAQNGPGARDSGFRQ